MLTVVLISWYQPVTVKLYFFTYTNLFCDFASVFAINESMFVVFTV